MSEPAEEDVAAKVMPAPIAEAILRAWDGRRLTLASAKPVVRAWMRAHGWSEDRWGNFKINETTRFHFGKQVFRKERNLGGYWQGLDSRPMIDAANVLLGKAASALGREPELAKITKAKAARREEKAERRTKAEEDRLLAQARDWTMKYIAQELPEEFVAWKTTGEQGEEFKTRANELHTQIKSQILAGGHFSDGEIVSSDSPPIGAFFDERLKYSWEETADGVRYTIDVIPRGAGKVAVHIGKPTASGFGQRVDPATMTMSWEMTMQHEGDGYLTGQVIRTKDGTGASLFMLIAHEKQRGAGGRMLDLWCTMLSAYGVEDWVAEAVGDEGQAFIEKKVASGRLELLARRGTNLFVRCVDQAGTAPERMMPNAWKAPKDLEPWVPKLRPDEIVTKVVNEVPASEDGPAEFEIAASVVSGRGGGYAETVLGAGSMFRESGPGGEIHAVLRYGLWIVTSIVVEPVGKGIGTALWEAAAVAAEERGGLLASADRVSEEAEAFWQKQEREGRVTVRRQKNAQPLYVLKPGVRSLRNNAVTANTASEYRDAVAAKLAPILGAALAHEVAANFASVMLYGDDADAHSALEETLRQRMRHPETYQAEHLTEAMVQKALAVVVGDDALRDGDLLKKNPKLVNNGSSFADRLAAVRVLFRAPETLALWGIPYELRPGQSPRDLWDSTSTVDRLSRVHGATIRTPGPREGWVLISPAPGWWGNMGDEEIAVAKAYIAEHKESAPGRAYEWAVLPVTANARRHAEADVEVGVEDVGPDEGYTDDGVVVRAAVRGVGHGRVEMFRGEGAAADLWIVDDIEVEPAGAGIGTLLWEAAAREATKRGGRLASQARISRASQGFWKKQMTLGRAEVLRQGPGREEDLIALKPGVHSLSNNARDDEDEQGLAVGSAERKAASRAAAEQTERAEGRRQSDSRKRVKAAAARCGFFPFGNDEQLYALAWAGVKAGRDVEACEALLCALDDL